MKLITDKNTLEILLLARRPLRISPETAIATEKSIIDLWTKNEISAHLDKNNELILTEVKLMNANGN